MATPELTEGEEYDFEGVHIDGVWIDGEFRTYATVNGWARREFLLDVDKRGGHIDWLEHAKVAPVDENSLVLGAIAQFARKISPEIITVEDYLGTLH